MNDIESKIKIDKEIANIKIDGITIFAKKLIEGKEINILIKITSIFLLPLFFIIDVIVGFFILLVLFSLFICFFVLIFILAFLLLGIGIIVFVFLLVLSPLWLSILYFCKDLKILF